MPSSAPGRAAACGRPQPAGVPDPAQPNYPLAQLTPRSPTDQHRFSAPVRGGWTASVGSRSTRAERPSFRFLKAATRDGAILLPAPVSPLSFIRGISGGALAVWPLRSTPSALRLGRQHASVEHAGTAIGDTGARAGDEMVCATAGPAQGNAPVASNQARVTNQRDYASARKKWVLLERGADDYDVLHGGALIDSVAVDSSLAPPPLPYGESSSPLAYSKSLNRVLRATRKSSKLASWLVMNVYWVQ